ncbi:MAG: nucleotidyltransferase family protein [Actinomycetota bacterium]|nr:nucleotidyltransferase family protein [Actinomycetota bacterium]
MASWAHPESDPSGSLRKVVSLPQPAARGLWEAVDELVDRAPRVSDLTFHRLHLLGARRYRETGRLVPRDLAAAERNAAILNLVVPVVLERARNAYDRTIVVMKGPEAAARYPDPALRPFGDLDLLVPDAAEAQRALLAAGFVTAGSPEPYVDIHHLQPLQWPDIPLFVEIHDRPKWPARLPLPSRAELLASAIPGTTGVPGVLTLPPELHAMVLAAHSWAHTPLARIGHLVDLASMTAGLDRRELDRIAAELGMRRLWGTSIGAADALFEDAPVPWALRSWARNLCDAREQTVFGSHLTRWLPPWWALSTHDALRANAFTLTRALGPLRDEPWRRKLRRMLSAFRHAGRRLSEHHRTLGEGGR